MAFEPDPGAPPAALPDAPRVVALSQHRIAAFEQCPRRLWLSVNRPDLAAADQDAQARFDAGRLLAQTARSLHPGGVMVTARGDGAALDETARLMADGHAGPIFAGVFAHRGVTVRVDMLERMDGGRWRLVAVKSSASAKDHHLGDLATQVWVLEGAGIRLGGAVIRHIDTRFVLAQAGDYAGLFADHDLLTAVRAMATRRTGIAAAARGVLLGAEPVRAPGRHCGKPYPCAFAGHCAADGVPGPEWPVTVIPAGGWKKWAKKGVTDLLALDETAMAKPREAMIVAATRSGVPYHDGAGARRAMADWTFPRAWLDFETVSAALPRWVGTRPYQQVPFQFSLHLEQADGGMSHHEFLCADGSDPRRACAQALADTIPADATVIAYNAGFERSVLRALAAHVEAENPAQASALEGMAQRTVDLLPVARNHWYHRDQRGSWSIKAVLPTMADLDYASLEVKDGGMAQESFLEAIDPVTSPERRWALTEALKAYCARDTMAMVLVARRLSAQDWPVA